MTGRSPPLSPSSPPSSSCARSAPSVAAGGGPAPVAAPPADTTSAPRLTAALNVEQWRKYEGRGGDEDRYTLRVVAHSPSHLVTLSPGPPDWDFGPTVRGEGLRYE